MKPKLNFYSIQASVILMYVCLFLIKFNCIVSYEWSKLYRQKQSANYFHIYNQTDYEREVYKKSFLNTNQTIRTFSSNVNELDNPKPWLKKDKETVKANQNAEEAIDPDKKGLFSPRAAPNSRNPEVEEGIKKLLLPNCGTRNTNYERVVNGKDAALGAYPWAVVILKSGDAWCAGTILNEIWVLTASHCFMSDQAPESYAIRVGTVNRNEGTSYKVSKIIMHERFHLDNMFNSDIALMKIAKKIQMNDKVNGICLSSIVNEEVKETKVLVIGWGQLSFLNRDLPSVLQEVELDVVNATYCAIKYKTKGNIIYKSQLCTYTEKKDACQGDSGSSATVWRDKKAVQIGVVSYGSTCADDYPGVYTKISYFLHWIVNKIKTE